MATPTQWKQIGKVSSPEVNLETDTVVRQSTIGQMLLCEMRVGYEQDEGFLDPVNEKMCFGTFVHYMVEQDLREDKEQVELLTNMGDWVNEILVTEYDWSLDQVNNRLELFSELGVAYRNWRKQIRPKIKSEILGIEEEIYFYLGPGANGNIFLKGTPDLICKSYLRDVKTAGKGWKQAKADVSIQASLYLALAKLAHGTSTKDFIFDVYNRQTSQWESLPVERTTKQVDSALKQAYAVGLKLEAGLFSAHPVPESSFTKTRGWYCKPTYCGAWNVCEFKYLGDDLNEDKLVAIRSWN